MNPSSSPDARYRALADPVRRRLLRMLEDCTEPCDVQTLAAWVRLHPNTVRGHLDLMEKARLVTRGTRPRTTPGRPRVVYEAVPQAETGEDNYRLLAHLLATTLRATAVDPVGAAEEVGRSWGRSRLDGEPSDGGMPAPLGVHRLTALLDEMGFEPRTLPQGARTVIEFHDCPFRDLARQHADLVCSLHLGLMRGAAQALGSTEVERLQPFVGPSMCRTVMITGATGASEQPK